MAVELIDLDAIIPDHFQVKIKGEIYELPKSVDLQDALKMWKLGRERSAEGDTEGNIAAMEESLELLGRVFHDRYPKMDAEKLRSMLTLQQATVLLEKMLGYVFEINKSGDEGEEGAEGNP